MQEDRHYGGKESLTIDFLKQTLGPILRSYNITEAKIFGSYAKGCPAGYSDVDIYVDSGLRGLKFFGLLEDVVTALPIDVDLVDKRTLLPDGPLYQEIMRTGLNILEIMHKENDT